MVRSEHVDSNTGRASGVGVIAACAVLAVGVVALVLTQGARPPAGAAEERAWQRDSSESAVIMSMGSIVTYRPSTGTCEVFERWTAFAYSFDPLAFAKAIQVQAESGLATVHWAGEVWRVDRALLVRLDGVRNGAVEYDLVRRAPVPASTPTRLHASAASRLLEQEQAQLLRAQSARRLDDGECSVRPGNARLGGGSAPLV